MNLIREFQSGDYITKTMNTCCAHDIMLCELCTCYNGIHEDSSDCSSNDLLSDYRGIKTAVVLY